MDLRICRRSFVSGAAARALLAPDARAFERRLIRINAKATRTTGAIVAGSHELHVASAAAFAVNDHIIVEIGGEAGAGVPGTAGVGGQWPTLSYATKAVMNADASQATGTYCWCTDTGYVYEWNPNWAPNTWWELGPSSGLYYTARAQPRALLAKITGISGFTLTLDTSASQSAANANVYFDNAPVFNALATNSGSAFVWPAGTYYCGSKLNINHLNNCLITGAGQSLTTGTVLKSPKGCLSMQISCVQTKGTEISNLRLYGNVFLKGGWGMDGGSATAQPYAQYAVWALSVQYLNLHDVTVDHAWFVCDSQYGSGCRYSRVTCNTDGLHCYISWMFNFVNAVNCWSYDCVVNSTYLTAGFECFASNHCGHIRPVGNNAVCALNSCGWCLLNTPRVTVTAHAQLNHLSFSSMDPMINVNSNISQNQGVSSNAVRNPILIQKGYINSANDTLHGIDVSGKNFDTLISGGVYIAPDYKAPSTRSGPLAVNSDSSQIGTVVKNLKVIGAPKDRFYGNIHVMNGSVTSCNAQIIVCAGPGCHAEGNRN